MNKDIKEFVESEFEKRLMNYYRYKYLYNNNLIIGSEYSEIVEEFEDILKSIRKVKYFRELFKNDLELYFECCYGYDMQIEEY